MKFIRNIRVKDFEAVAINEHFPYNSVLACARRRRLVLDESAQNELLGLAIPQCEQDGKWYRRRYVELGKFSGWIYELAPLYP